MLRIAVDIGGTFTDLVILDETTGKYILSKESTTPKDQSIGVLDCFGKTQVELRNAKSIIHGSTVVINTLLEGKGAKTGLITTKGFRDVYEIARMSKPEMYNPFYEKPRPLVPRHLILEIDERMNYKGENVRPLDDEEVKACVAKLRQQDVISIAVCLLHSYMNPSNETRVEKIIKECFPEAFVSVSHNVSNEWREYERTSTTAINAYVRPIVVKYLENLETKLQKAGLQIGIQIMQSNGGLIDAELAKSVPVQMIESGPAAGIIGAISVGELAGFENIISFDMGGTTAKASLVEGKMYRIKPEYIVLGHSIRAPVMDLEEVGAGGGSLGWIDSGGAFHVGPRSAGAEPGPACYGKGGTEPTVTDANLLLGRINPENFLGGEMKLDTRLAFEAIRKIGEFYGKEPIDMASDIVDVADSSMMGAIRLVSVQKGFDPREFALVAYGGAGPMHACTLAKEMGIPRVLIPRNPAHFSAWGMLLADFRHDYVQVHVELTEEADVVDINDIFGRLENEGRNTLTKEGILEDSVLFVRTADMRYVGQEHTVNVPAPSGVWTEEDKRIVENRFHDSHEKLYTFCLRNTPTEFVAYRVAAIGKTMRPSYEKLEREQGGAEKALKGKRRVFFKSCGGLVECQVYERGLLHPGNELCGPAIIEEPASTTVLHQGQELVVDDYGNLIIKTQGSARANE